MSGVSGLLRGFAFKRGDSPVHRLDPRAKLVVVACYAILSLSFTEPLPLALVLLSTAPLAAAARRLREWGSTFRGVALFALLVFVANFLTAPTDRLNYSVSMVLRLLTLTSACSLFFLTTTPDDLALAMECSGLPREYSLMVVMSIRFIPALAHDLQTIMDALRSRGFRLEKGGLFERARNHARLLVPLIVYELRRSIMVAEALEARGFGSGRATRYVELRLGARDYLTIAASLSATAAVLALKLMGLVPSPRLPEVTFPWT